MIPSVIISLFPPISFISLKLIWFYRSHINNGFIFCVTFCTSLSCPSSVYESVTTGIMLVSENNDYRENILSKGSTFRATTLWSPLQVNRSFGGTCILKVELWWVNGAWNQRETDNKLNKALVPVPPKHLLTWNLLHSVVFRKVAS
jgi:hypothetical protein